MTMRPLSSVLRSGDDNALWFWCLGCDCPHKVHHGAGSGPRWGWNGDAERPTFTPSVLVTWTEPAALRGPDRGLLQRQVAQRRADPSFVIPQRDMVCHTFVREGRIEYLGDCTHALAGQTVDLPVWPAGWGDDA